MKKVLQPLFLTVLAVPSFVFAAETASAPQTTTVDKVLAAKGPTSAQAVVKQENTTVISPRTGIRYTLGNTGNRPIFYKLLRSLQQTLQILTVLLQVTQLYLQRVKKKQKLH
ncbi:hypothetical protein J567_3968 [Acinetobacter baumannii 754286]|nr:hypothetical protein J567_3968 [Acinetobacter baumannii 754286]